MCDVQDSSHSIAIAFDEDNATTFAKTKRIREIHVWIDSKIIQPLDEALHVIGVDNDTNSSATNKIYTRNDMELNNILRLMRRLTMLERRVNKEGRVIMVALVRWDKVMEVR